ncbi:cation transporter [Marivita sp. GX14005]|uniref:heavy-metal-associated domain-containing protein n=1 Tax=Marivita sp. GX14005 TaxID=2942276 RepID=UPI00201A0422|nr:cation transporter [Marivita sp. GX14005]MCL3881532.1 cation transporter [Marivita sp. GX14005]
MTTFRFTVDILSCAGCAGRAERALHGVNGVFEDPVNIANHTALVERLEKSLIVFVGNSC